MDSQTQRKRVNWSQVGSNISNFARRNSANAISVSAKPALYLTLATAAVLGVQNRDEVKSAIDQKEPTVTGTLIDEPVLLFEETQKIGQNTEQFLPSVYEAEIDICSEGDGNDTICEKKTVYWNLYDVVGGDVKRDGANLVVTESFLEGNSLRPRSTRER